jgi:hypothetical protein
LYESLVGGVFRALRLQFISLWLGRTAHSMLSDEVGR